MGKNKFFLIGSVYEVLRFLMLSLLGCLLLLFGLFSVNFDFKNYDLVFTSRLNSSIYYGIEYGDKIKIWKIERSDDGSLYTRRLYP